MTAQGSTGNGANGYGLNKVFTTVIATVIATGISASAVFTIRTSVTQARIDERLANQVQVNADVRAREVELQQQIKAMQTVVGDLQTRLIRIEERMSR
jgi:uncharacterized protein YlxW (UPF0749 family)